MENEVNLTARQELLIKAVCRGLRRKEIAVELGVGESAVKRLLEKLFLRFNQNSMRGLAVAYLQARTGQTATGHKAICRPKPRRAKLDPV